MLSSTGCLITSTPTYDTPQQTPPMLIAGAATPPLTHTSEVIGQDQQLSFSAELISEDADHDPSVTLLVDYGSGTPDHPYHSTPQNRSPIAAGTLSDGPRSTGTLQVSGGEFDLALGPDGKPIATCHTVTMLATHNFEGNTGCPVCLTDSSTLTWLVVACPTTDGTQCKPFELDASNCGLLTSQWTNGCPIEDDDAGTCQFQSLKGTGQ